ncbi:tyrosine-type recombinase/integrase [Flammeovirga kamogawensis]|uniref:Tyrosine-type recombinase/integrase n=1 Tax=Flammeovirga kamogawensis TaxID=373891 RepID=A0ABX8GT43_9BACT|nr:tyrosine-type recombinase/integrase [Flammeovirga kamogawensis]MBB6463342.1 integrase [Flammeovirga kamogawensis]QWG06686.1 tyrosine-type recombinase/integrase [Flammeovirga kamogawensis]TRX68508.1 tyrosine-type recombinase/integrase [Flammeovirga kamogawensis]
MKIAIRNYRSRSKKKANSNRLFLYLDFYHFGVRKKESLNAFVHKVVKNKEEKDHNKRIIEYVKRVRAERLLEIQNDPQNLFVHERRKQFVVPTLEVYIKERKGGDNWTSMFKKVKKHLASNLTFENFSHRHINDFRQKLLDAEAINQDTASAYFNLMMIFCREKVEDGVLSSSKMKLSRVKNIPNQKKIQPYLLKEEVTQLVKTDFQDQNFKNYCMFSVFSGLRGGDIRDLRWTDIEGQHLLKTQNKTNNDVFIPKNKMVNQILEYQKKLNGQQEFIFDVPASFMGRKKLLNDFLQRAGIERRITFHSFRRTFGTLLHASGNDLYTIKEMLGHQNIANTERYVYFMNDKKEEASRSLDQFM